MKGKLISISGLDGAGKSTQLEILKKNLIVSGLMCESIQFDNSHYGKRAIEELNYLENFDVVFTRLCIDWSQSYPLVRDFVYNKELQKKELAMAVTAIFAGGCIQVYEECIKPLIDKGITVICDRFWLDDIVYRSFWVEEDFIRKLYQNIPRPDLPILLNTQPDTIYRRNTTRIDGKSPLMKTIENTRKISEKFLELAIKESIVIIDGNGTIDEIAKIVYEHVINTINKTF